MWRVEQREVGGEGWRGEEHKKRGSETGEVD